jgi:phosphatidylglycerophosphate synthase
MKKVLEKFIVFLHRKYGITPNELTFVRIFAAPWLALLISKSISSKSLIIVVFTLLLYALVVSTDFFDGLLARHISKNAHNHSLHNHSLGGMLDRLSDKLLILFILIPFGLNLFTFSIVLGESLLAYQAITSQDDKKGATGVGKLKMVCQTLVIPLLLLSRTTNFVPYYILFPFIILTIVLTYMSAYSHYFDDDESSD